MIIDYWFPDDFMRDTHTIPVETDQGFFTHDVVYQQHEKYILRDKGFKDKTRVIFEIYL